MTTSQPLTAVIYDSITEFQRTAHYSSLQHAQMRQYLAEHLAEALSAAQPRHGTDSDAAQPLDLDAIEARAQAATPGPWGVYESGFVIEIAADLEETGCGYRARRGICRLDEEPLDNDPTHREWTAEEDWAQVQADAAFIATMSPDTVRAMADEIRRLRAQVAAVTGLCDEQEMAARLFELPTPEWIAAVRRAVEDAAASAAARP
jgi:hypothetical protein